MCHSTLFIIKIHNEYCWILSICNLINSVLFQGARNLNPVPYNAEYVGFKLHMDQNEKLCMFGVTHEIAIDGFGKKNCWMLHLANKKQFMKSCRSKTKIFYSNISIFLVNSVITKLTMFYFPRNAVLSHGMWDQVRVDHGRPFGDYFAIMTRWQHCPLHTAQYRL